MRKKFFKVLVVLFSLYCIRLGFTIPAYKKK